MGYELQQFQSKVTTTPQSTPHGVFAFPKLNRMDMLAVSDFYLQALFEGLAYSIRAGTITTPLVGDVVLTDAAAEMALDAPSGVAAMPVYCSISINLGTGTLHEYAIKSVAGASSAGDVYVPLPIYLDGTTAKSGSRCSARVDAAGGVTVTAELNTTTRMHWSAGLPVAVAAGEQSTFEWNPKLPPIIQNNACCYVQIAATTTGPSYYANLDFIELKPENIY
jgi:hypothetical protein